ncbi:mRNA (guanine-N7-)-methyltransferase [Aureococcus anophagefferens]|nr:mRNA (guanine-N7-)-methyltransferase [Aureococcus anophagefferens]
MASLVAPSPFDATSYVAWARTLDIVVTREDDALALRLLYERRKGAKSRWGPHIALLPATPPHALLRWSEVELGARGLRRAELANRWRSQVSSDFSEIVDKSRAAVEESDPGKQLSCREGAAALPWLDLEGFSWAVSMIWSRCVSVSRKGAPPIKAFLPVVDMHNHDPGAGKPRPGARRLPPAHGNAKKATS